MRLNVGKRILMFFHWLFSLLICAAFALYLIVPDFIMGLYGKVVAALGERDVRIIGIAILAIYAVLAIAQICLILKRGRRTDRGFITVDSSETGRVRIAISAIEQMVRQSVHSIEGIAEMKISIDNKDDAIVIGVAATIINGSHVPTITMNMQRAIRQFVEMNCGVAVRAVAISINGVTNPGETSHRRRRGEAVPAVPVPAPGMDMPQPKTEESRPRVEESHPEPATPVFSAPEPKPEPKEEAVPEIDFNYKPRLELTPTVETEPDDVVVEAPESDAGKSYAGDEEIL